MELKQIKDLKQTADQLKAEAQKQILREFRNITIESMEKCAAEQQSYVQLQKLMSAACDASESIGPKFRDELIESFVADQLNIYSSVFPRNKKESKLEMLNERFKWIKRRLKDYKKHFTPVFPEYLCVPHEILVDFCLKTRQDIVGLLREHSDNMEAPVLYKCMYNTIKFEHEMHSEYHFVTEEESNSKLDQEAQAIEDGLSLIQSQNSKSKLQDADSIKQHFQLILKKKELERLKLERQTHLLEELSKQPKKKPPIKIYSFKSLISKCFEDYMGVYLQFEDKTFEKKLAEILKRETWDPNSNIKSCEEVIIYISESLNNCKDISISNTLFQLTEIWKKYLRKYCDILLLKLPRYVLFFFKRLITNSNHFVLHIYTTIVSCLLISRKLVHL